MREPWFWRDLDPRTRASAPLTRLLLTGPAALYAWAGQRRIDTTKPYNPGPPVICIGNLTLGGAGKTPVAAAIRGHIARMSLRVGTLSRGYGGTEHGPLRVDPSRHTAAEVGDEPLMLSVAGESWIARDRVEGAKAMAADGVDLILMDDGHQNPTLAKALSVVVIDTSMPFGNGHVFPKGPLREPVARGLGRADAVVLMGDGAQPAALENYPRPILRARLTPDARLPAGQWVAFAGIGRPERFFDALRGVTGVTLTEAVSYGDHHPYTDRDIAYLRDLARTHGSRLVTTEKDYVRLPAGMRDDIYPHVVRAAFEDVAALDHVLAPVCSMIRP